MKKYLLLATSIIAFASCGNEEQKTATGTQETEPAMSKGKAIFNANCTQCHKLHEKLIGPALEGAIARWDNDTTRIRAFIHNSQEAIKNGDPRAVKVYAENNQTIMTPMPHLSNADIDALIDYINKGED
ncbi:MAG: cytochrome c [Bacteroidetes bacterium]|nr:cytochrome c [Bacteroidota bacterium]